jgi:methylenetetrahydrofolate reductase (NADPH)
MKQENKSRNILVICQNPELADITRHATGGTIPVTYAATAVEGVNATRELHPDVIILGPMGSPDEIVKLYGELREGWISHHASVIIAELNATDNTCRVLSDENLTMGIGEYIFRKGSADPFQPADRLASVLQHAIARKLYQKQNRLKASMLNPDRFCVVWEQIPGPGAFELRQEKVLENARTAALSRMVCAISITDNPGGNPAIATDILCNEIKKAGIDPLVHIAFRDRSRNQAESLLFQLAALDINNVLILTGDYPSSLGFTGRSKPVFDLDSINGLRLVGEMNKGLLRDILRKAVRLTSTNFYAGAAFSPFKRTEAEVMGQYYKLGKKIEAGADFVVTQVGYDARKLQELPMWLKARGLQVPALAGIYVLSHPVAKAMHENNIPGCVVTETLLRQIAAEFESGDKGKQARLDRAAKMFAIAKGLGYKGAYISGQGLPFESLQYIVERGTELSVNWTELASEFDYPQENGFYFFERESERNLNKETPAPRTEAPVRPLVFLLSQVIHKAFFEPASPFFRPMRGLMRLIDSSRFAYSLFHWLERWSKSGLYGCKDCGDCALFDAGYLCPVSQCPKDQRNGPCGGSYGGWCEVYPGEKQCIWVKAYLRLKSQHREEEIGRYIVPPCNWELHQSSSWINYFLGRDHSAKLRGIEPAGSRKLKG